MRPGLVNRIRDELRRDARRPSGEAIDDDHASLDESPRRGGDWPGEGRRYEAALAQLKEDDREVLIPRLELGLSYPEIALSPGRASAKAARMAVVRALVRLIETLDDGDNDGD
jgi:DNA-directed RNA polymerase specialized sigma24 family protein